MGRSAAIRGPVTLALVLAGWASLECGPASHLRAHRRPVGDPTVVRRVLLGRSLRGRPITAVERGDSDTPWKLLVVGCIHGNETAGISIARALARRAVPRESDVWVIDAINPDGVAARTRQNARGVDLNRNFPYRWRPLGRPGDQQYSGPRPLSEPESRIVQRLILRLHPGATLWFHQPLGVVDQSGGSLALESRFARLVGLPLRRLTRYPGSAAGWQNRRLPGTTAFVVELPPGSLRSARLRRYMRAVLMVAAPGGPRRPRVS
jgi:protein MpaA